ncbi:hypothetical protein ACFLS1_11985 [Verrucomicrobiota bacterium]
MARKYGVNPCGYGLMKNVTLADRRFKNYRYRLSVDPCGYGSVYQHVEGALGHVASDTIACIYLLRQSSFLNGFENPRKVGQVDSALKSFLLFHLRLRRLSSSCCSVS